MTYALGRGLQYYDMPVVRDIVRKAERQDYRFSGIIMGIVTSTPFQMRVVWATATARRGRELIMFVTKKALPRRTFLRGVGTAMALPLLESMVPAFTALAQTPAKRPMRFGAVYFPNGAHEEALVPRRDEPGLEFKTILKPLEPFRDQVTSVRQPVACRRQDGHRSRGQLRRVAERRGGQADRGRGHPGRHQHRPGLAKQIGQDTPLPSMEVATEDFSGYVGGCVPGYSCAYMNTHLVGVGDAVEPDGDQPAHRVRADVRPRRHDGRASRRGCRKIAASSTRSPRKRATCSARSGRRDRARLGDYLDNVREIERRIQRAEAQNSKKVIALDAPLGVPDTFEEHAALMFDLLAVAYQSDITRVFSFMMSREASQRTYPELNIPGTHHDVSHHGGRPENMENHAKINLHYAQLFASFVEKLQPMPEGDGTVLDNSLIFYGAGMSDGQAHAPYPLPLVAVGGAGGKVKGDRHIVAAEWTPVANLWLRVADLYGARSTRSPRAPAASRSDQSDDDSSPLRQDGGWIRRPRVLLACRRIRRRGRDATDRRRQGWKPRAVRALLLKQPAELKIAERDGTTALHWAVRADDLETVRLLLRAGADANAATREGITPLAAGGRSTAVSR